MPVDDLGETRAEQELGNVAVRVQAAVSIVSCVPFGRTEFTHAVPIIMLLVTVCGAGSPLDDAALPQADGIAPSETGADSSWTLTARCSSLLSVKNLACMGQM